MSNRSLPFASKTLSATSARRPLLGGPLAFTLVGLLLLVGCNEGSVQPSTVTATARVTGTDGVGTPSPPLVFSLNHAPDVPSPRVVSTEDGMQNVSGMDLTIQRTGVPFAEAYVALTLSRSQLWPESNDPNAAVAGGTFVRDRVGDIAMTKVDPTLLTSPLTDTFSDFPPALPADNELAPNRPHAVSYLARIEEDDPAIPFRDPGAVTDVSRLSGILSGAILSGVTTAANSSGAFRMGGADGAGDLRTYFVPHITHSTLTLPDRNVKGFGLIVAVTVDIVGVAGNPLPLAVADVFVPVSVLFEPDDGPAPFRIFADPFSMIGSANVPADNLARVFVSGRGGLLDGAVIQTVSASVMSGIAGLPTATIAQVDAGLGLLAAVFDATLGDEAAEVPEDFDVILLPELPFSGVARNRLRAGGEGIPATLHFLL